VNGIKVSDFITHYYYDPSKTKGRQYSFTGAIQSPHQVLEGGYISFGNPIDNHWYQIIVQNGAVHLEDLGVISTNGKSLRETVDRLVGDRRQRQGLMPNAAQQTKASAAHTERRSEDDELGCPEAQAARARSLREEIGGKK